MQIHVVIRGDTLFKIANTYGTSINQLTHANELDASNELVIGQTLVIPIVGQFYFVQVGDSLYSIANKFGFSVQELAEINHMDSNSELSIGFRLYIPTLPKVPITSFYYIEPFGETVSTTLENTAIKTAPYLTYLARSEER